MNDVIAINYLGPSAASGGTTNWNSWNMQQNSAGTGGSGT